MRGFDFPGQRSPVDRRGNHSCTTFIPSGDGFNRSIVQQSNVAGCDGISPGVYFLRGYFVNVEKQLIILSQTPEL